MAGILPYGEMLKDMEHLHISKSIKELLGDEGQKIETWGDVNRLMQKEIHKQSSSITPDSVAKLLQRLFEFHEAWEERKNDATIATPGPSNTMPNLGHHVYPSRTSHTPSHTGNISRGNFRGSSRRGGRAHPPTSRSRQSRPPRSLPILDSSPPSLESEPERLINTSLPPEAAASSAVAVITVEDHPAVIDPAILSASGAMKMPMTAPAAPAVPAPPAPPAAQLAPLAPSVAPINTAPGVRLASWNQTYDPRQRFW